MKGVLVPATLDSRLLHRQIGWADRVTLITCYLLATSPLLQRTRQTTCSATSLDKISQDGSLFGGSKTIKVPRRRNQ